MSNLWIIIHISIGVLLAIFIPSDLESAANTVLLPLAGIFIGLTFAWAGNAQALLQSKEISDLTKQHSGGLEEYVYTFQTAILVIMITMVLWGLAGLKAFSHEVLVECNWPIFIIKVILYCLSSLTLRECWHVVLGSQYLLLAHEKIKEVQSKE